LHNESQILCGLAHFILKLMNSSPTYVLSHSPLVGELTWALVADEIRRRGRSAVVSTLVDSQESDKPFWRQHADSVAQALSHLSQVARLILVAHSGTGPLLPAIRQRLANPIHAYVFVDAGIPCDGATRLDLMKSEDSNWAKQFEEMLQRGERFPTWNSADLREIVPDESLRKRLVAEIRPRGLDFFTEPIPVFDGWPDARCIYIMFSRPYGKAEIQARENGWETHILEAGHFHMLVDPKAVADIIIRSVEENTS
jgi:pimeloyl-ACP methyl ester carboxylesterase